MSRWRNWDAGGSSGTMPRTSLATRLGLEHKDKTRVFDDFLGEGLNSSAGLREKSIDELADHLLLSSIRQAASQWAVA